MLKYRQSVYYFKALNLFLELKGLTMSSTNATPSRIYNYDYINSGFDLNKAHMDEATVYYIKLMTPGSPGFLSGQGLYGLNIDQTPIDYEDVDLGQRFNDETLFSAALKNDYLNQAIGILKYVEPFLKATQNDPNNLNHRFALYNILKLDDEVVLKKLDELARFAHKGLFEENLQDTQFDDMRLKAEIIRSIEFLSPVDFPKTRAERTGTWFKELIKNENYAYVESYLTPYVGKYAPQESLIADLSLEDSSVANKLNLMADPKTKGVFRRIDILLRNILPSDVYLKYILQKDRYDLRSESKVKDPEPPMQQNHITQPSHSCGLPLKINPSVMENETEKSRIHPNGQQVATKTVGTPANASGDNSLALFAWATYAGRGGK